MGNVIYSNVVGSTLPKSYVLETEDGITMVGVLVGEETVMTAKPSDIKIGKLAATNDGIVEGTNTITYRTEMSSYLIFPYEDFSIPLDYYNTYDYTKIQCVIALFNTNYGDSAETMGVTIGDSLFSVQTSKKLSNITKNNDTRSVDLNITNNSENIYEVFYFTYRKDTEEEEL